MQFRSLSKWKMIAWMEYSLIKWLTHFEPGYLIKMLNLCYQKLMSDYFIIIETVNPLSFVSFVNFYIDLSHIRFLHTETMRFLLEIAGFQEDVNLSSIHNKR